MKKALILVLALGMVMTASLAFGQGAIKLYTDQTLSSCNITNDSGTFFVTAVHEGHNGATASQFKLQNNGHTMIYLADNSAFSLVIGNTQAGIAVSYGGCFNGQISVVSAIYSGIGTSPPCSSIEVVPDPNAPTGNIEAVDCANPPNKVFPAGSILTIKYDGTCDACGIIVPVEETNWGRVKSLYSN